MGKKKKPRLIELKKRQQVKLLSKTDAKFAFQANQPEEVESNTLEKFISNLEFGLVFNTMSLLEKMMVQLMAKDILNANKNMEDSSGLQMLQLEIFQKKVFQMMKFKNPCFYFFTIFFKIKVLFINENSNFFNLKF